MSLFSFSGSGPPFEFDGVVARIFPLRASRHVLERVVDTYLNEGGKRFQVAAPYVILSVLNYGRMSSTRPEARFGWVAQDEVFFAVPVVWERGYAVVAPFIFVDQPWSIDVGRELYGWPKEAAFFQREVSTWASHSPAERENVLSVSTRTFVRPYAGEAPRPLTLLEIDREPPLQSTRLADPRQLGKWLGGPLSLAREALRVAGAGVKMPGLAQLRAMVGTSSAWFHTVNLKQVRDLERPELAAYQAITAAPMRLSALRRAGLLGESQVLLGDPSGGYRIRLRRHAMFPIAETLGLEVGESDDEHVTLEPLLPYWLEADLVYGRGEEIAWRSDGPRYEVTWDARNVPTPPYYYPRATLRCLPLPADLAVLRSVVDALERPPGLGTLTPASGHVLLVVATSEEMSAGANSLGTLWEREIALYIPVIWERGGEKTVVLLTVATFVDGHLSATALRAFGAETVRADIYRPRDAWLEHAGPRAPRRLLELSTQVLPALHADVEAQKAALLEIRESGEGGTAEDFPILPTTTLSTLGLRRYRDADGSGGMAFEEWFTHDLRAEPLERGGFLPHPVEVLVHHFPPPFDVVGALGLHVHATEHAEDGTRTRVLRPERPFWLAVDLSRLESTSFARRAHGGAWAESGAPLPAAPELVALVKAWKP